MQDNLYILNFLDKLILADKTTGSFIFSGPKGSGKKDAALYFAQKIIKNPRSLANHPDVFFLEKDKDKKNISIESVRHLIGKLSLSASLGKKIAIIQDADNLNINGFNALLKTLEEPKKNTTIILITKDLDKILPTIISRSQVLRFKNVNLEAYEDNEIFGRILNSKTYLRLKISEEIEKKYEEREDIINFLINFQVYCYKSKQNTRLIAKTQEAIDAIKQNGNMKIILANLLF